MAKKNVFPFVEAGLKVVDNDVITGLGPASDIVLAAFNANEDKNVEWFISSDGKEGAAQMYPDKKDHEILFDFNQIPSDVYSEIDITIGDKILQIFHGSNRADGDSGEIDVDAKLIPGSIFCIGVKNKKAGYLIRNFLLYSETIPPNLDDLQYPFRSRNLIPGLNNGVIDVGNWLTYMFDGKRLVFLGSNNWV
tara:strand:+ start:1056 stop:1634 length:579 start_codon:yes stop_codon:yes gene_type:complete